MAESGDTYSNEGDSCAPEGMGDDPGPLEHAQKVGHICHAPAPPCNFLCAPVPGLTCSISLHVLAGVACLADVRADEQILHAAVAHRRRATVAALHHFALGGSGQGPQGSKVKFDTEFS